MYENIEINKGYKYPELCELLGEKIYGGSQKKAQIKKWQQYLMLEKSNGKIFVRKIYNKDEIRLIEESGKYTTYIRNFLICALNGRKNVKFTYNEFMKEVGMVNENFATGKIMPKKFLSDFSVKFNKLDRTQSEVDELILNDMILFLNVADRQLKVMIDNSLKKLERESLILCNRSYRLYRRIYINETQSYIEHKDLTKDEVNIFLNIRKSVMEQFGVEEYQGVIFFDKKKKEMFFNVLSMKLNEEFGYDKFATLFDITCADKFISAQYSELLKSGQLNKNIINKFQTTNDLKMVNENLKNQLIDEFIKT